MNAPRSQATEIEDGAEILLVIRNLARSTPAGKLLLHPVSFSVHPNDRILCQGSSGSGKTVLLRALAKLDESLGELYWLGKLVANHQIPTFRAQVIYLQQRQLMPEGSVREALREPFHWHVNQAARYDENRVVGWMERLGRKRALLDAKTGDLSGGELQIVALVRALQLDPTVLLLDEPTSALDNATTIQFEQLILDWQSEAARAVMWVTHNHQQADRIATRRFEIETGRVTIDV